jgi:penicillin amidase
MRQRFLFLLAACAAGAETARVAGLRQEVEIRDDRWGAPHIYAKNEHDLFYAQGWTAARDRLFQIDLWRRAGIGRLAEVQGPAALPRDRLARLVRFRGDWKAEWASYGPGAYEIAKAFTDGINAYLGSLKKRPAEFERLGYDPGRWQPEDVTARMAGLVMMRNLQREVDRALRIREHGLEREAELFPPDPPIPLRVPRGLDLADITPGVLADFRSALRAASGDGDAEWLAGSNNWAIHGSRTATGRPLLANDPHRPLLVPSLRKTVHLVAPGWNAIGAGEPALPGIALGHNEQIGFGFTIVGIDQMDLYVETLNPANPEEYRHRGAWRRMELESVEIAVRGRNPVKAELRYTLHGPVLHVERQRNRAYALRWVGAEPGAAGYLAALRLARARDWKEFHEAARFYKVPSENLIYADRAGHIGWIAAGAAPVRRNHDGLLPVPGESGAYEWEGSLPLEEHPQQFDPPQGWIATANHNILPLGFRGGLSYEWALPFRFRRIAEALAPARRFSIEDMKSLQQDVFSLPARRFQALLRKSGVRHAASSMVLNWDCRLEASSAAAAVFEAWIERIYAPLFAGAAARPSLEVLLTRMERAPSATLLEKTAEEAWRDLERTLGPDRAQWRWGRLHQLTLRHPAGVPEWNLGPLERPGDANTPNAAGGAGFRQANGASYRQILDLADWDRSVMTNVPGESGNPESPHYKDLLEEWHRGGYHPMPFSRSAVEAATERVTVLQPAPGR